MAKDGMQTVTNGCVLQISHATTLKVMGEKGAKLSNLEKGYFI